MGPGPMQKHIAKKMMEAFMPEYLEVTNESHGKHSDESHFFILVVSSKFDGMSPLERQRSIYALLSDSSGKLLFHSPRLLAKTPAQWRRNYHVPVAPACSGKGDG